jgi:exodeoxyribonuclease-3
MPAAPAMKVATWNVNSVRQRLDRLLAWIDRHAPDVVCLQETKVVDEDFPREALEARGYRVETYGQKTYNGVALLAKRPLTEIVRGLPDDAPDAPRRVISAVAGGVRLVNVYVPNGESVGSDKFRFKLDWLARLATWIERDHDPAEALLIVGDFNVAPEDRDVHDPDLWRGQVLFHPDEHRALARLTAWGLSDLFRRHHAEAGRFTWWDYRALAFPKDHGLRIDLMLGTASVAERCRACEIEREERKGQKPSDHVPVWALLG